MYLRICLKKLAMGLLGLESREIVHIVFWFKLILSKFVVIFRFVGESGYKLKNQFKNMTEPFSVVVAPG